MVEKDDKCTLLMNTIHKNLYLLSFCFVKLNVLIACMCFLCIKKGIQSIFPQKKSMSHIHPLTHSVTPLTKSSHIRCYPALWKRYVGALCLAQGHFHLLRSRGNGNQPRPFDCWTTLLNLLSLTQGILILLEGVERK